MTKFTPGNLAHYLNFPPFTDRPVRKCGKRSLSRTAAGAAVFKTKEKTMKAETTEKIKAIRHIERAIRREEVTA